MQARGFARNSVGSFAALATALLMVACAHTATPKNASAAPDHVWPASATEAAPTDPATASIDPVLIPTDPSVAAPMLSDAVTNGSLSAVPTDAAPLEPAEFTVRLAGDVHFAERTADLLAENPATALREAADQLRGADIVMVNLETAITDRGSPAPKQFHFRAPPAALDALHAGGIDVASLANNHAVDFGDVGLADTLAAVADSPVAVIGIGADSRAAYAPYVANMAGHRVAILAASQVHDWTLAAHTVGVNKPGIANSFTDEFAAAVAAAVVEYDTVIVYLHWGIEYDVCPSLEQRTLTDELAAAGVAAVVGTHAHVLQGAGWRDDGVYVAYGLGNYYWWRSFGNEQDDNVVLTLTFRDGMVVDAETVPTHLDQRGVPQVATGSEASRIERHMERNRQCADLRATPPF